VIKSFRHKGLGRFFENDDGRRLPPEMLERIRDVLTALDGAMSIEQLNRPSFRLHPLKGAMKGIWAVTILQIGE
jgi:toxin HigB-1